MTIQDLVVLERRLVALEFISSTQGLPPETRQSLADRMEQTAAALRRVRDKIERDNARQDVLDRARRGWRPKR